MDIEKYPEWKEIKEENMQCEYGEESFTLTIQLTNNINKYVLLMPRTREKSFPKSASTISARTRLCCALKVVRNEWCFEANIN